jgi:protein-L-isoaspartate(D-aspartate) O-methyltransferase
LFSNLEEQEPNRTMSSFSESDLFEIYRRRMVEAQLRQRGISDQGVLDAMARVPRHEFAPERYRNEAYEDHPLPIGEGQTISQPYIVALMLEALALKPTDRVLEVGTGSGYVTALLAELTHEVISVERHPALADAARDLLERLRYENVKFITGDGSQGYAPFAPYNAIVVSAAAPELPRSLLEQLAEGGRMIIPVGQGDSQQLQLIRMQNGGPQITLREFCRFVPLVSDVAP